MTTGMIPFTDNYQDKSTEYGYQFEFDCERCGNGYSSSSQKSAAGMGGGLLRAASGLFAGAFGRGASTVEEMADMARGAGRDAALRKAVEEMRPYFHQCHRCGNWVCRDVCWNEQAGLCTACSPSSSRSSAPSRLTNASANCRTSSPPLTSPPASTSPTPSSPAARPAWPRPAAPSSAPNAAPHSPRRPPAPAAAPKPAPAPNSAPSVASR